MLLRETESGIKLIALPVRLHQCLPIVKSAAIVIGCGPASQARLYVQDYVVSVSRKEPAARLPAHALERMAGFYNDLPMGIDERQLAGQKQENLEKKNSKKRRREAGRQYEAELIALPVRLHQCLPTALSDLGCTITSENAKQVVRFLEALEAENIDIIEKADNFLLSFLSRSFFKE
mgnify:CR=1 FL=1